jgi:serine/threonine protein phosphatase PrpC
LPALIAEGIRGIEASGIEASIAIKDAIKAAFTTCEREVLPLVDDGCCVIGMLVDRRCTPARAYVANLGDSRAFACVEPAAATADAAAGTSTKTLATAPSCAAPAVRAIALSKDHVATDPKERRRIEVAGGVIEHGRVCGMLEVTRSLGDRLVKQRLRKGESAKGEGISAVPDVTSFAVGLEQRFVLMASDGFWKAWTSSEAIEVLHARLCAMDRRREVLATVLDEPTAASALTREAHAALIKEREGATEEGCLKEMVHVAVHMRHAKDNVTALLVRMPPAP